MPVNTKKSNAGKQRAAQSSQDELSPGERLAQAAAADAGQREPERVDATQPQTTPGQSERQAETPRKAAQRNDAAAADAAPRAPKPEPVQQAPQAETSREPVQRDAAASDTAPTTPKPEPVQQAPQAETPREPAQRDAVPAAQVPPPANPQPRADAEQKRPDVAAESVTPSKPADAQQPSGKVNSPSGPDRPSDTSTQ